MVNSREINDAEWFVLQICHLDIDRTAKNRVLSLVQRMAGQRIYFQKSVLKKPVAIAVARALLDVKAPVVEVRNRLLDGGYCSSTDAAYRVIQAALDSRKPVL